MPRVRAQLVERTLVTKLTLFPVTVRVTVTVPDTIAVSITIKVAIRVMVEGVACLSL